VGLVATYPPVFWEFSPLLSTAYGPLAVSILALSVAVYAVFYARVAFDQAATAYHEADRRAPGLKRLTEIEVELTELKDSYAALLTSHKKIRSRIGMRELREREADQTNDPATWKQRARAELVKAGKLNAKFHTP
jgi:hypothetical protein